MQVEVLKGSIVDVCAELEAEARRCKKMTVGEWLRMRELDRVIAKQFGMTEDEYRREMQRVASK
jgi:hypothetical protein